MDKVDKIYKSDKVEKIAKNPNSTKTVLAVDMGASGGRVVLGFFADRRIKMEVVHRFENIPVTANGTVYWDVLRIFDEIKKGILAAKIVCRESKNAEIPLFESIGIDTWGVDFGLLDSQGQLLGNAVHYRDSRTVGMLEKSAEYMAKTQLYKITGLQFMELNTAFQLLALKLGKSPQLEIAQNMLLMPDLFNYFLTDKMATERTMASTSQLYDISAQDWSAEIISALGLPPQIFGKIVQSGTIIGKTAAAVNSELGISPTDVCTVAGHDTQSAMVAVPTTDEHFAFISCGTWSLLGTEVDKPIVNAETLKYNVTNEAAYYDWQDFAVDENFSANETAEIAENSDFAEKSQIVKNPKTPQKSAFMKNIAGLWLIQESRRQWEKEGKSYSFAELEEMANAAEPFRSYINPDNEIFATAGDIPGRIAEYCRQTGQPAPQTVGEIVRCINESLAFKHRQVLAQIEQLTARRYPKVYIVGGGTQSRLLCQMTANATAREVIAGSSDATALGNIAVQLITKGYIKGLADARRIIIESAAVAVYYPQAVADWELEYERFCGVQK